MLCRIESISIPHGVKEVEGFHGEEKLKLRSIAWVGLEELSGVFQRERIDMF